MLSGNLYAALPGSGGDEQFASLLERPGLRIERIVSVGQASPPGFWYEQTQCEWVVVLRGRAKLRFADEATVRELGPGDHVDIAAGRRHRVDWTTPEEPTIWLAVHYTAR